MHYPGPPGSEDFIMNVFCYGTLMFDSIWSSIITTQYLSLPGIIRGYSRKRVQGETYPCLIQDTPSSVVPGRVYLDVECRDVKLLDAFEGEYYRRTVESCRCIDGSTVNVYVYVLRDSCRYILDDSPWDPLWFAEEGLAPFTKKYGGFARQAERRRHQKRTGTI